MLYVYMFLGFIVIEVWWVGITSLISTKFRIVEHDKNIFLRTGRIDMSNCNIYYPQHTIREVTLTVTHADINSYTRMRYYYFSVLCCNCNRTVHRPWLVFNLLRSFCFLYVQNLREQCHLCTTHVDAASQDATSPICLALCAFSFPNGRSSIGSCVTSI
jgi:hypothetical protein